MKDKELLAFVRNRILELSKEQNLSLNKLCSLSGVSHSTLNSFMNGDNKTMRIDTLYKLCITLNTSLKDIFFV